jgi:DNA-binding response OmpR family regulator
LLLEDEVDFREEIADFLTSEGYQVLEAGSVAEFTPLIEQIDIAVIDIGLPDGDGMDVAATLRSIRPKCGIIMLTALGSVSNKILSLRGSADYYLVKPVRFDELLAHMKALERRVAVNWRLLTVERQLHAPDGHCEALTEHEMILLELLAGKAGEVVSRRMIATAFGIDWIQYDERRLDQMVSRLRRRWRSRSGQDLPFRTEHGRGYSFCADIQVL